MPKLISYTKGSLIYFENDKDDRIFILQKGMVVLTSSDVETGEPVVEYAREGEFFGVKSAFGRFPREETATVVVDSQVIAMSVAEFEQLFSSNKQIIMKMLIISTNRPVKTVSPFIKTICTQRIILLRNVTAVHVKRICFLCQFYKVS